MTNGNLWEQFRHRARTDMAHQLPPNFNADIAKQECAALEAQCYNADKRLRILKTSATVSFWCAFIAVIMFRHVPPAFAAGLCLLGVGLLWSIKSHKSATRPLKKRYSEIRADVDEYLWQRQEESRRCRERDNGFGNGGASSYLPVSHHEWTEAMTERVRWAHGWEQRLLPDDIVLKFRQGPLGPMYGHALQRYGKIVAEDVTYFAVCSLEPT